MARSSSRAKGDGLYLVARSRFWQIDKTHRGQRFRISSKTTDREKARGLVDAWIAKLDRDAVLEALGEKKKGSKPEMTLKVAVKRYFDERGCGAKSAGQIDFQLGWIAQNFNSGGKGADTLLSDITENQILELGALRRTEGRMGSDKSWRPCTESTIRRAVYEPLRTVLRRALIVWKVDAAVINWKDILPIKSKKGLATREVSAARERELMVALRGDMREWVAFDFMHGARCGAISALEWDHVDTETLVMKVRAKTVEPGIHYQEIPLFEESAEIIERQRPGGVKFHPKYVFTYVVHRAHWADPKTKKQWVRKGERRPLTKSVMRQVKMAAKKIGLDRFRPHDIRHTAISRILRESQNLELARQAAGHSDIATTAIYSHVLTAEVRDALRAARRKSRTSSAVVPTQVAEGIESAAKK